MNIIDAIKSMFGKSHKPTPADFRRGVRKTRNIVGMSIDLNSKNRGLFMGNIVPMKRRFKGVSRTARKS
jgi:hypothetical protein